ncbi:MAG: type I-G CRISPR-associated protein, Cas3-extension family [Pseudonocardiaceae bacterium]
MTTGLELPALDGTNPLGFLAALGVLDVLHRSGRHPTMYWTDDIVPVPRVDAAVADADELIGLLDADRVRWGDSVVLHGPAGQRLDDVKPAPALARQWASEVAGRIEHGRAEADLFCALLSEGGVDGKGSAKPSHLHFTAGQQKFLVMVRELAERVDAERLGEAVFGPWREDSPLPTLSWSSQGERIYALRGFNPSDDKRLGVPGADWLALLGLVFFPTRVVTRASGEFALETSGCDQAWKRSALRWPVWRVPLGRDVVWSLVGDSALVGRQTRSRAEMARMLGARGVLRVMQAPIRRNDQGGYGSFGGATVLIEGA